MSAHDERLLTDAVIALLTAGGLLVGDAEAPDGHGWQGAIGQSDYAGFVTVYDLTGGTLDGSVGKPDDDASVLYQLTSTGASRQQCKWVAAKARAIMLAQTLAVTGRAVLRVSAEMLGGTQRDDDVQPPVFFSPDRYRIWTAPA